MPDPTETSQRVLDEIHAERARQHAKFGEQNHPDGTDLPGDSAECVEARQRCDTATENGRLTWRHILAEEVAEVFAESDPELIRAELLQVGGVVAGWMEAIDRRACDGSEDCPSAEHHDGCFAEWIADGAEGALEASDG